MQKKLTLTIDERVYKGLHAVVGRRRISQFIGSLVKPHVLHQEVDAAYHQMAQDEAREAEALEWAEATVGDVSDEARTLWDQVQTLVVAPASVRYGSISPFSLRK